MIIFPVHFGAGYFGAHRPGSIPGGGFPIETSIGAAEPIRVSYVWDIRIGRLRLEAGVNQSIVAQHSFVNRIMYLYLNIYIYNTCYPPIS